MKSLLRDAPKDIILSCTLLITGCEEINVLRLADAGKGAITAVRLSPADIREITEDITASSRNLTITSHITGFLSSTADRLIGWIRS